MHIHLDARLPGGAGCSRHHDGISEIGAVSDAIGDLAPRGCPAR